MRKISYLSHDIFILSGLSRMTFMKTELLKEKLIIPPLPPPRRKEGRSLEIKVEIKSCVHAYRFTNRGNSFFHASRGAFFRRLTISSATLYCNFVILTRARYSDGVKFQERKEVERQLAKIGEKFPCNNIDSGRS